MFPHPPGAGGPGSFQTRFENELKAQGHKVCYKGEKEIPDLVFVVGGTKKLFWLSLMRLKGIPVLYRLDGIGWLHNKRKTSLKYYWTAELRNAISKCIHGFLATKIVYQSRFVKEWWDRSGWKKRNDFTIIHNGVNIPEPNLVSKAIENRTVNRLLILEGTIDYTPYAVKLLNELAEKLPKEIQIEVYGKFEYHIEAQDLHKRLLYKGFLKREDVYNVFLGAVYLSLDIQPGCPNTVAEALACGAPVVAFNTGALPELVDETCGKIVEYGSNPWDLDYPDSNALVKAINDTFLNYDDLSRSAFLKAKTEYSLSEMLEHYLKYLNA